MSSIIFAFSLLLLAGLEGTSLFSSGMLLALFSAQLFQVN